MPKPKNKIEAAAKAIAKELFTDGVGRRGSRLVLEFPGTDLGGSGWCERAVVNRIEDYLKKHPMEDK